MTGLFDFDKPQQRLSEYVHRDLALPDHATDIPIEVLRHGELARGQASRVTKTSERAADDRVRIEAIVLDVRRVLLRSCRQCVRALCDVGGVVGQLHSDAAHVQQHALDGVERC